MKIKTTGELRAFLAEALTDVRSGKLGLDEASRITKLASQINESFYSEIKVAKIRSDAGEQMQKLGCLPINDGS
ncbi:MAG: hypothetical protein E6Q97_18865 [Desulfurellales bacterium]|nr:MAG: hypothetical protein E6Q97_18865 [Desulfurellales bacterium]